MPIPSALTNDQKTYLRSETYQATAYVAINPNATVATARINQASFGTSVAQLTFDNGSGTGNVLVGQTVYISRVNDIAQSYFRGRVRKAISGSTLFIDERSASFADNDYIFIINDVALHPKLPRNDGTTDYIDYDITYRQGLPIVYGLQSAYVVTLDSTPKADLALAPSAFATASGASISTWSWSAPSASFQAGNSSTQNVTLRWTTAGVYWVRLTITDSGSRSNFITFPVFVCSADYSDSFIKTGIENISITGNETGYQCSLTAFDGVESILDQTLAVVFSVEKIGTSTTPIVSNVNFVGRLRQNTIATEASPDYVNTQDTDITLEDIASQMARCPIVTWSWTDESSPSVWGDIANLTIWRALSSLATDFSTLSNVSSIRFDSTADTYRTFDINQNDSALFDGMNNIADAINARPSYTPQNELFIYRSARFLSSTDRESLTTVMDFELQDMLGFDIDTDPAKLIGRQVSYGGAYNTTSQDIDLFQALAPGVVSAEGVGQNESTNQVLTANNSLEDSKNELGQRGADDFQQRNPITKINATLHDGFHFINPNNFQWYTFTITTDDNNRGLAYDTSDRWLCEGVSARYDGSVGTWDVSGDFGIETVGGNYQTVVNIAPNEEDFYLAPYPIDDPYPEFPDDNPFYPDENPDEDEVPPITPQDKQPIDNPVTNPVNTEIKGGDVVAVWNSAEVWLTTNFTKTSNPKWTQIYSGSGITDFKFGFGNSGYVLQNDGVDSTFWRTGNVFAGSPVWGSATLTGVYELIRVTSTAGEVFVLSNESPFWTHTFDFTSADEGFATRVASQSVRGATGWISSGSGATYKEAGCKRDNISLGTATLTGVQLNYYSANPKNTGGVWTWQLGVNGTGYNLPSGTGNLSYSVSVSITTEVDLFAFMHFTVGLANDNCRIVSITLSGIGTNPFGGGSGSQFVTAYSTNNGLSFASPVSVGTAPPQIAGFDTQRIGDLVYAGADAKVRQATNGGAYSDTTNGGTTGTYPLLIRSYGQSGVKLIIGTPVAISGDTLFKLDGGQTAITPNDGSNDGIVVSPNCVDMWITSDSVIVGIFDFGGTYKLGRSTNGGSSWSFTTSNITSDSKYIRVRQGDTLRKQVYTIQSQATIYSNDTGATTQIKSAPGASLLGIEVKS